VALGRVLRGSVVFFWFFFEIIFEVLEKALASVKTDRLWCSVREEV
jgi:hypothetical protein